MLAADAEACAVIETTSPAVKESESLLDSDALSLEREKYHSKFLKVHLNILQNLRRDLEV